MPIQDHYKFYEPKKWQIHERMIVGGKVRILWHLHQLQQTTYSKSKLFVAYSKFRKCTKETTNSGLSESTACKMLPNEWAQIQEYISLQYNEIISYLMMPFFELWTYFAVWIKGLKGLHFLLVFHVQLPFLTLMFQISFDRAVSDLFLWFCVAILSLLECCFTEANESFILIVSQIGE